tara:strand:+ start:403 stop:1551 length:1149 start_codon:yes stop_codon:yes gene_type:complete
MLEQAIIDARELKEAAQKNAQEAVIERYQSEIKEAVDKILEQEEAGMEDPLAMGLGIDPAMEGSDVGTTEDTAGEPQVDSLLEQLPFLQTTSEDEYIDLDLRNLEESLNIMSDEQLLKELNAELEESIFFEEEDTMEEDLDLFEDDDPFNLEEDTLDEDLFDEEISLDEDLFDEGYDVVDEEVELEEDYELEEDNYDSINLEEDHLDEDLDVFEEEIELEEEQGDLFEEKKPAPKSASVDVKNNSLLREQKKLGNKVQLLENKLSKYGTVINKLKNKLNESNLLNAKLLYQNRVLDSISLNERQKDKIVEAIQNTNSVEEAKIIFETLQSTVGSVKSKSRKAPESLNEVVTRSSSAFIPRKEEKRKDNSPFAERMKILAGLK